MCVLHLAVAVLAALGTDVPSCACAAFCAGDACNSTCHEQSFHDLPPNGRTCLYEPVSVPAASRLVLYRITPSEYWSLLDNTNLGDAAGDMSYIISVRFIHRDGASPVITRSEVDTSGTWGPYEFCNPAAGNNWTGASCNQVFGGTYSYYSPACRCPRANTTVRRRVFGRARPPPGSGHGWRAGRSRAGGARPSLPPFHVSRRAEQISLT